MSPEVAAIVGAAVGGVLGFVGAFLSARYTVRDQQRQQLRTSLAAVIGITDAHAGHWRGSGAELCAHCAAIRLNPQASAEQRDAARNLAIAPTNTDEPKIRSLSAKLEAP